METNNKQTNPEITQQSTEKKEQPMEKIEQPAKNNWIVPLLFSALMITLGIAGVFAYQNFSMAQELANKNKLMAEGKQQEQEKMAEEIKSAATPTQAKTSTTESIDDTWNLYTNNKLGFSMKIPKKSFWSGGACADGKLEESLVPVATFDDQNGTYISYEYFYEYPINNSCKKTTNSLDIIQERNNLWKTEKRYTLVVPSNWHIITTKIESDEDLENFIKVNYGEGCKLGDKSLSKNELYYDTYGEDFKLDDKNPSKYELYDVEIKGDGLDWETSKCIVNYVHVLKYSPELKKAVSWKVGQEVIFSADYKTSYDLTMIESFKFLN